MLTFPHVLFRILTVLENLLSLSVNPSPPTPDLSGKVWSAVRLCKPVAHHAFRWPPTGSLSHTKNKGGHIPRVFPHERTSWSRGRAGHRGGEVGAGGGSNGDWLRMTLPLPSVLSALFTLFYSSPSQSISCLIWGLVGMLTQENEAVVFFVVVFNSTVKPLFTGSWEWALPQKAK